MNNPKYLFSSTFIVIISVYLYVFGEEKTIQLLTKEYIFILILIALFAIFFYLKFKLKEYTLFNFINKNNSTLKTTIIFFMIFQVYDYFVEGGFIGMISQWFSYWLIGLIAFFVLEIINYYKNYKIYFKTNK